MDADSELKQIFDQAIADSFRNRDKVLQTKQVSCFHCVRVFSNAEIKKWTDKGQTPICPHCDIDAVLPGIIPIDTLEKIKQHCFS
jgi:hypothetical protein